MNATALSTVRRMAAGDVPDLAGLFGRVFLHRPTPPDGVAAMLHDIFLDPPFADPDIGPLVHQRADGRITGFMGVMPLPLRWGERTLRGAVCGALMVDHHETDPLAGARLMRSFLSGPQDVSLCETASPDSAPMWQSLRGVILPQHSLRYMRILSPLGYFATALARRTRLARPLKPLVRPFDRQLGRRVEAGVPNWLGFAPATDRRAEDEPIGVDGLVPLIDAFTADYAIRPDWTAAALIRILTDAADKPGYGPLTRRLVRAPSGAAIGAFLYHGRPGDTAYVLQLFARASHVGLVLESLFARALADGHVAVTGRTEPHMMSSLLGRGLIFTHGPSSGIHARDPAIVTAALHGELFANGIAGETWSRLIGHSFG